MGSPKTNLQIDFSSITLPKKTISFIKELATEHPTLIFKLGPRFSFRPPRTIFLGPPEPYFALLTLHELGHALSEHKDYRIDVERLKIESAAWQKAKLLCKKHPTWAQAYNVSWDEDFAEAQLDTYRDWLHRRSLCPKCHLTRFQTPDAKYHCPNCELFSPPK